MENKTNDKHIVEEAINDLLHLKKQLVAAEETSDFQKGANTAAVLFAESIDARIEYLKDVLTWYDDTPNNSGTYEVKDCYKQLIKLALDPIEGQGENEYDEEMTDTFLSFAFRIVRALKYLSPTDETVLKAYLCLADHGKPVALLFAAQLYEEADDHTKALEMYETAYEAGVKDAAECIMTMVYEGHISESDLKRDYGIAKVKCTVCQNDIYDIDFCDCNVCGWGLHYMPNGFLKNWRKDPFNMMSIRQARRLFKKGLTVWKKPLPHKTPAVKQATK